MAYNKFIIKTAPNVSDRVMLDLTADTVTAEKLASGITAHDKRGIRIIGTGVLVKEVLELPTENISETFLYYYNNKYYRYNSNTVTKELFEY